MKLWEPDRALVDTTGTGIKTNPIGSAYHVADWRNLRVRFTPTGRDMAIVATYGHLNDTGDGLKHTVARQFDVRDGRTLDHVEPILAPYVQFSTNAALNNGDWELMAAVTNRAVHPAHYRPTSSNSIINYNDGPLVDIAGTNVAAGTAVTVDIPPYCGPVDIWAWSTALTGNNIDVNIISEYDFVGVPGAKILAQVFRRNGSTLVNATSVRLTLPGRRNSVQFSNGHTATVTFWCVIVPCFAHVG